MSAFTHGFNHAFVAGIFNRMFGSFNMFNFNCWNSAPIFFTPNYNFNNFVQYPSVTAQMPSIWSQNVPDFKNIENNLNLINSTGIQQNLTSFGGNFNQTNLQTGSFNFNATFPTMNFSNIGWGDCFTRVTASNEKYSDNDTSYFSYDAKALKQKWDKKKTGLSQNFYNKVVQVAKRVGCDSNDLMALMYSESGLNASKQNSIGATGLIQIVPNTAKSLGTTTTKLKAMSPEEQLVYVEKYLLQAKKSAGYSNGDKLTAGALYAITFLPANAKKEVLSQKGDKYYAQNSGLDANKDGKITKLELAKRIERKRA